MILLGPVADAARGGHSNPFFDLLAGLLMLALTWIGYAKRTTTRSSLWICVGISMICGVFIYFGIAELVR
jgi:hypothetical protein